MSKSTTFRENESIQRSVLWRHPATDAPARILVWRVVPRVLVRSASRSLRFAYALQREGRSFLGRMQTLLAKKHWGVDLGPEFQLSHDGRLVENEWTKARSLGTQALVSAYPWASTIDLQMFLEGVRLGEQSALRILGFGSDKQVLANVALEPWSDHLGSANSMPVQVVQQSSKQPGGATPTG